jgi:hypothetical protein
VPGPGALATATRQCSGLVTPVARQCDPAGGLGCRMDENDVVDKTTPWTKTTSARSWRCRGGMARLVPQAPGVDAVCPVARGRRRRLSMTALTATMRLEPDIDRAAISGRSTRPKAGSKTPAAIGSAIVL